MSEKARWHKERLARTAERQKTVLDIITLLEYEEREDRDKVLMAVEKWVMLKDKDEQSFDSD